jgi:cell division protein FtsQ
MNPESFPITTVQVKGQYPHIKPQVLQEVITPYTKKSFFAFSPWKLRAALQQIPWVGTANIRRVWPTTVEVTITEKQPIALWNGQALMAADGSLFTPHVLIYSKELPRLSGPKDQEAMLFASMQKMNQLLHPLNLTVQQLILSPRHSWSLMLSNHIQVVMGQDNIWLRLEQFIETYPKVIGDKAGQALSVDLRYPNGMAVQWRRGRR